MWIKAKTSNQEQRNASFNTGYIRNQDGNRLDRPCLSDRDYCRPDLGQRIKQ